MSIVIFPNDQHTHAESKASWTSGPLFSLAVTSSTWRIDPHGVSQLGESNQIVENEIPNVWRVFRIYMDSTTLTPSFFVPAPFMI